MVKKKNLIPLLLTLALSLGACGHKSLMTAEQPAARAVHYVSPDIFRTAVFPTPPAKDSMEEQADLAGVLAWQNKRTEEDCARARRTEKEEYEAYWGAANPFGGAVPPEFKEFFDRLASDFEEALDVMKDRFRRPRPFVTHPEAEPCLKKKKSFSYPSGHASASRVTAEVLSDIVPGRRGEFFSKADEIARDRLVGGAHYPADVEAGKAFGDMFHGELEKSEAYRKDVAKLKALVK